MKIATPTLILPTLLRSLRGGAAKVEVEGGSLGEVRRAGDSLLPGLYGRIVAEGRVRPELAIAMDGEVISLALHAPIAPSAELTIVAAIGGG
jgi:hypothetical protein